MWLPKWSLKRNINLRPFPGSHRLHHGPFPVAIAPSPLGPVAVAVAVAIKPAAELRSLLFGFSGANSSPPAFLGVQYGRHRSIVAVMLAAQRRRRLLGNDGGNGRADGEMGGWWTGAAVVCGRGDKKTRLGKRFKGSYDNARPKKEKKVEWIKDKVEVFRSTP